MLLNLTVASFLFSKEEEKKQLVNVILRPIPSRPEANDRCACARKWVVKARGGDLIAMTELGNCYSPDVNALSLKKDEESDKCHEDVDLRAAWLGAAATRGFAPAQYQYGMLYFFGVGVKVDKQNAANWMVQSAGQGYPEAYYTLGEVYQFGLGREQNLAKARQLFEKAASLGELRAKERLKELRSE
ncbi:MAG: tetratricopeptide repeat protein [Chryseobacterium sp.]